MRLINKGIYLAASLMISGGAFASMSLDRMIIYFNPNELPRQDVIVTNPEAENLYLQTEVYKVLNPGTDKEERIRITDPSALRLLASPRKAIIAPNSRKTVRLVNLETPKGDEQVYRVTFKPVVGDLKTKQNAIKLLVAYQALVFVRPDNPKYKITSKLVNKKIIFTNHGNINVVLRHGRYCSSDKKESCVDLDAGRRIYANTSWTLPLPEKAKKGQGYIQYGLFDGDSEQTRKFTL